MTLSNLDRELLQSCLAGKPEAWDELTDRYLGLIVHVVNHTAASRNIQITPESRDDLVAEVFLSWLEKDFSVLRRFRGNSSLATYLTVVARRVVIRRLSQLRIPHPLMHSNSESQLEQAPLKKIDSEIDPSLLEKREELESTLARLSPSEATAVRMFHVDGRSYDEIGRAMGVPTNSVGPILSKAREKMRNKT